VKARTSACVRTSYKTRQAGELVVMNKRTQTLKQERGIGDLDQASAIIVDP